MKKVLLILVFVISCLNLFSQETVGTRITSGIVPNDSLDNYPSHFAYFGMGGLRTVPDTTARDSIYTSRREVGMLVYVQDMDKYYVLKDSTGNGAWEEFVLDSTGVAGYAYTGAWVDYYTFSNGLTESGGVVKLGDALTESTYLTQTDFNELVITSTHAGNDVESYFELDAYNFLIQVDDNASNTGTGVYYDRNDMEISAYNENDNALINLMGGDITLTSEIGSTSMTVSTDSGGLYYDNNYSSRWTTDRYIPDIGKTKSLINDTAAALRDEMQVIIDGQTEFKTCTRMIDIDCSSGLSTGDYTFYSPSIPTNSIMKNILIYEQDTLESAGNSGTVSLSMQTSWQENIITLTADGVSDTCYYKNTWVDWHESLNEPPFPIRGNTGVELFVSNENITAGRLIIYIEFYQSYLYEP